MALLERSDQALSVTDMARATKEIVDRLVTGEQNRYVLMRNNTPAAVLMSIQYFEALTDEIKDLKIQLLAVERAKTFKPDEALSHEDIRNMFPE